MYACAYEFACMHVHVHVGVHTCCALVHVCVLMCVILIMDAGKDGKNENPATTNIYLIIGMVGGFMGFMG